MRRFSIIKFVNMNEFKYKTFSAVVPAYNESTRFGKVVEELLKIKELSKLIFVDDGSIDSTSEKVKKFGSDSRFIYLRHNKNKGKGAALQSGLNRAKTEIVLFLDADLENITSAKIKKIVFPVLKDEVDVARGSFKLARGRVTEIAVKPMMKILFPDLYFDQPISGQVCAKREFLKKIDFEDKWGVDIGILMDAINDGQRIIEVNIGKLEHKARNLDEKVEMAGQVLETMIKKAGLIHHKYKLVIFTLDDTLILKETLNSIFIKLGILEAIKENNQKFNAGSIKISDFLKKNAKLFSGIPTEKITQICSKLTLAKYSYEVIHALQKRKYQVGIISSNFFPIAYSLAQKLGVNIVEAVGLVEKNGVLTGEITENSIKKWIHKEAEENYKHAFDRMIKKIGVKPSEVVMVASTERALPLMLASGFGIAYKPKSPILKILADKTISVHAEILAIIE